MASCHNLRLTLIASGLAVTCALPAGASTLFSATASASGNGFCGGFSVQNVTNPISASASASFSGFAGETPACLDPTDPRFGAIEVGDGMSQASLATGVLQASAEGGDSLPIKSDGGGAYAEFTDTITVLPIGAGLLMPGPGILTLTLDDSSLGLAEDTGGSYSYIIAMIAATQNGIPITPSANNTCMLSFMPVTPDTAQCNAALQLAIPIDASDTTFSFTMLLNVGSDDGYADAFNTAQAGLILPAGDTFTSASGVFLTEQGESSVPEPASIALLFAGLLGVAAVRMRKAGIAWRN